MGAYGRQWVKPRYKKEADRIPRNSAVFLEAIRDRTTAMLSSKRIKDTVTANCAFTQRKCIPYKFHKFNIKTCRNIR